MEPAGSDYDIVIDIGSNAIKAIFCKDSSPMTGSGTKYATYPPIYGTLKTDAKKLSFGEEAWTNRANLNMKFPVEEGYIRDWDHMDEILSYCFKEKLGGVDPSKHNVLVVDGHPLINKMYRKNMAELMFEKFGVPKFQMYL